MDPALVIARILLATVFAVAAVAKFRDPAGTRAALAGFRLPPRLRHPISLALPAVELALAVMLVPSATAQIAAVGASVLLAGFTIGLASVVARGDEVECNCLGSISRRPVGGLTIIRNVVLLALAGLVATAGAGPSAIAWIGGLDQTETVGLAVASVLAIACALNFAFAWQLMKQNGRLRAELAEIGPGASAGEEGAALGDPAPPFELPALGGGAISLEQLLGPGRGVTIVFSDAACSACDPLLPTVGRVGRDEAAGPLVMIVNGDEEAARTKAAEHGIDPVLFQDDFALARSYGVPGIPAVIRLAADGSIAGRGVGAVESAALLAELDPAPALGVAVAGGQR